MGRKKLKTLYVDMDNVLVNFQSGIDSLTEEQRQKFKDDFDVYILSTAPWNNPSAWTDKLIWVKKYLGDSAHKRLILSHNKNLNIGDYLIDDRTANGAGEFKGEHIHFLSEKFKNWKDVLNYLIPKDKQ